MEKGVTLVYLRPWVMNSLCSQHHHHPQGNHRQVTAWGVHFCKDNRIFGAGEMTGCVKALRAKQDNGVLAEEATGRRRELTLTTCPLTSI